MNGLPNRLGRKEQALPSLMREFSMERKRWRAFRKCRRKEDYIRHVNFLYPEEQVKSGDEVMAEFRRVIRERNTLPFRDIVPEYFKMGLNFKNRKLEDFVFWNEWSRARREFDILAGYETDILLEKQKHNFFFSRHGLPVPERLGMVVAGREMPEIISSGNERHSLEETLRACETGLFCKPYNGCCGDHCMKIVSGDRDGCFVNGKRLGWMELNGILHKAPPLLAEKVVSQHEKIAAFHPSSVNTLRLWTMRDENGDARFLDGIIRIGTGGSCTDNASAGGLCVGLNHEGIMDSWGCRVCMVPSLVLDRHPDSGLAFTGFRIPWFEEAKALVLRAHQLFSRRVFTIAWDVAVTPQGPLIIESNPFGGITTMQRMHGGWMFIYKNCKSELSKLKSVC